MSPPFITVLIDTFNHQRFIERAVSSVLEQDFPPSEMEILAVDDGSADATPDILARFAPRVRLLRKPNGGQASAFNFAIPEARGEVIAFLDGDDWWAPQKLTHVAAAMRCNPEVGLLGHGITEVRGLLRDEADGRESESDRDGRPNNFSMDGYERSHVLREGFRFRANTPEGARIFRLRKCFLGTSRMTLRANLTRRLLPVPEALVVEADEYLFTLAAATSDALILPEALTFYRLHGNNMFQTENFDTRGFRRKQAVLAALAAALRQGLSARGLPQNVTDMVTAVIQAEADQLRLMLDGGWPWETAHTEWRLFRIMCERPSFAHSFFKLASLIPAMMLPPRAYYAARQRLIRNPAYLQARQRWLPIPALPHVRRAPGSRA
jgi:glycosyltransferase involved in cell wall biosynthesis